MKLKKLNYRIGNIDCIKVPNDWHKVEGINAKRTETNMGLAERDYSKKCKTGSEPLIVVEGFWIWWCETHNQPYNKCCQEIALEQQRNKLIKDIERKLWLPCCHISGMHDPSHYRERKHICDIQKAEALERFCKEMNINPRTRSKEGCYWCNESESKEEQRDGEGLKLFEEDKK